jgi:glycosyltransferase involved in cell wall biosynthesis
MTSGSDLAFDQPTPVGIGAGRWPTVSVVIPTRERPELLRRCVRSVIEQRYPGRIECVVVFDQSDPEKPNVPVVDNRITRSIPNTQTAGLAGARNSGAFAATGELLAFCDDDDEWLADKVLRQVMRLWENPEAIAVASGIFVRTNGHDVARIPGPRELTFGDFLRSRWMEVNPCNILLRRADFLDRVGPVDEGIPGGHNEDYEWLLRATKVGPIAVVPEPLVRIHWHASSWFAKRWQSLIASHLYLLQRYPEFSTDRRGLARMYGQLAFYHAAGGDRRGAWSWVFRTLRVRPLERRSYVAMLVTLRPSSAARILSLANRYGRGI